MSSDFSRQHSCQEKSEDVFDHSFSHSAMWSIWKQDVQRVTERK